MRHGCPDVLALRSVEQRWREASRLRPLPSARSPAPFSLPPTPPAGQEELTAAKEGMGKRDRAMVASAKPLRGQGTKGCRIRVKVRWGSTGRACLTCMRAVAGTLPSEAAGKGLSQASPWVPDKSRLSALPASYMPLPRATLGRRPTWRSATQKRSSSQGRGSAAATCARVARGGWGGGAPPSGVGWGRTTKRWLLPLSRAPQKAGSGPCVHVQAL